MINNHRTAVLSVGTGLRHAVAWGVIGGVTGMVIVSILQAGERWQEIRLFGEYRAWLLASMQKGVWPTLGCSLVMACSAWDAYSQQPSRSIAVSLIKIAAGSILLWWLITAMELTPRRTKTLEHPPIYLSEFLILILPPLLVTSFSTYNDYFMRRQSDVDSE